MLSLRCRTTERTTTTMWTDRDSAATTVLPKRRRPVPWHWKTTSRIRMHTRSCSSTTIPTTWAAAATSPTWTARWFSTSSMCRSAKCSLKSGTASGIRLISSTRRNSMKRPGMYYYGARYYDPRLGLFLSVDRYAEKYPNAMAYNYTINNPINLLEINGDSVAVLKAPKGAGGAGHMAILIQKEN